MPRFIFTPPTITSTGIPQSVRVWDRATGGSQLTDLYLVDGSDNITTPVPNGILISSSVGAAIPVFAGPDDVSRVYIEPVGAARALLVATRRTGAVASTYTPFDITATDSANAASIVGKFNVTDDSSSTGTWPNRLEFNFGGVLTGYHNEYGEIRSRAAKTNTTAARFQGNVSGGTTDILQVTNSANNVVYFGASSTGITLANGIKIFTGTGTPEGAVTAPIGSTFHRTNGGAATSFYVKESGAGNTGWVAK